MIVRKGRGNDRFVVSLLGLANNAVVPARSFSGSDENSGVFFNMIGTKDYQRYPDRCQNVPYCF